MPIPSRPAGLLLAAAACCVAAACSDRAAAPSAPAPCDAACQTQRVARSGSVAFPEDTVLPVAVAAADGSTLFVHPDVAYFPGGWHGWRYWMVVTPPTEQDENPAIYVSDNGRYWAAPAGLVNPVARPPRGAYLSDPDLHFDAATGALGLVYRETGLLEDVVLQTRSLDGVAWSPPETLFVGPSNASLSPSVVTAPAWLLWSVDAGPDGCSTQRTTVTVRASSDGVTWGPAAATDLAIPGYVPWHLDVQYAADRGEYWAVVAAFPATESCFNSDLFLATSPDGVRWSARPTPVLARGESAEFAQTVYRSSLAYDATSRSVTVWFSGFSYGGRRAWHLATARYAVDRLLAKTAAPGN